VSARCVCGHDQGAHNSGRPHGTRPAKYGVCLMPGCGCARYAVAVAVLELNATPPSANRSGGRQPVMQHRMKKQLQEELEGLLMASGLPRGLYAVECEAVLRFPLRRQRDVVNYWLLDKALGDALVNGGWLAADTPDHYQLRMRFDPEPGPARTTIAITPEAP
jgi:hypothetical protein